MTKIIRVTECANCPNVFHRSSMGHRRRSICTLMQSLPSVEEYLAAGTLPPWCPLEQDRSDELQALLSALFGLVAGREEFERDNPGIIKAAREMVNKEVDE